MERSKSPGYGWWVTIISAIGSLTVFSTMTSYSMTASQLADVLGSTENAVMLGETIRMILWVVGLIIGGAVIGRIGFKSTVALAIACLLVPQFLFPYVRSYGLLLFLKAIQGLASMSWPAFVVATMSWVQERQVGLASGIFLGGSLAGGGIGGFIVGHVIPAMGWQASFWVLGLISLAVTVLWYLTVRVPPAPAEAKATGEAEEMSAGPSPFSQMLRMPETWLLSVIMLGSTWMLFGLLSTLPIYGADLGYDVTRVGNLATSVSIGYVVAALIAGSVSDVLARRMGELRGRAMTMAIGFVAAIVGAILLPLLAPVSFGAFYFVALISAFGNSWPQAAYWAVPSVTYPPEVEAAGTGFTGGVGNISDPISPLVIGTLLGGAGQWNLGWWTCAIASAVALIASLALAARGKSKTA